MAPRYPTSLEPHLYRWPTERLIGDGNWRHSAIPGFIERAMPEPEQSLAADSRWPAMFPSAICLVSTGDGTSAAIEKVVGPCIVNRFPFVMSLSFCRRPLSPRHYARQRFMDMIEANGSVAVQFLPPGPRDGERGLRPVDWSTRPAGKYIKGFTPYYAFPSANAVDFTADGHAHGMAYKLLPSLPEDQVEVDNDAARWPCFFPSSLGMITTWGPTESRT